ncbi:MAG: PaaI family thioesterase [Actinomycetota bacterium]|nr:PaaI family thioesterase [Actinomycetota bacterium]
MSNPQEFVTLMPFAAALGVRVISASSEEVTGYLEWAPERTTAGGAVHGGALMAFADSVGALCAYLNLAPNTATSTTSSSTVFLRAVRAGTLTAVAVPLHVGRTSIVVRTELRDDEGRLAAQVTQTQAVLGAAAEPVVRSM